MSIDVSSNVNNRRYFSLRRFSAKFSSNSKNDKAVVSIPDSINIKEILKQSVSNTKENSSFENETQTLTRQRSFKESLPIRDNEISNECISKEACLERRKSFIEKLKRNVDMLFFYLKTPEEVDACLQEAKDLFQNVKYKEAKHILIPIAKLKQSEKKSVACLYLTAIYLLEDKGTRAKMYSQEIADPYLKIVMDKHIQHILDIKKKDIPFPEAKFYLDRKAEDEKIVAKKLLESFGENILT
ncbi:MAG: hypothetical protein LBC45_04555 [Chlamydiales bacterium]|jgi:hypothetical protein|nr:hypothetical protein [Chlamydiales bacterium]